MSSNKVFRKLRRKIRHVLGIHHHYQEHHQSHHYDYSSSAEANLRTHSAPSLDNDTLFITESNTARMNTVKDNSMVIIDVRRPGEYKSGHIKGAICIPLESLADNVQARIPDLASRILIYSYESHRADHACDIMRTLGYKYVTNLGPLSDWTGKLEVLNEEIIQ